ncbi:MAG: PD-(D/E)XK nuclease family protein [Pseudomonadota bacterium]|nr:PD-(D/E)XK nuclease family protein [Pseudomonadota bacterium]
MSREAIDADAEAPADPTGSWRLIASQVIAWSAQAKIALRDAIVLVPFAQLLPPARAAFAVAGGWMPRIETTRTFAATLGPSAAPAPAGPSLDSAFDNLQARQLLARQGWAAAWRRNDPRGFERATVRLVGTCHELVAAAARVAPERRDAWWAVLRDEALGRGQGPGGRERALLWIAIEWAALAALPNTDRLFTLAPSAWISVQAGGADALVTALLEAATQPVLLIDTDADLAAPFGSVTAEHAPSLGVCASFEDEAEAAAAQILEHLRHGQRPVALIAQDRVLVRRIRALLERAGTALLDETGWKLSTTRAAAQLMTLLVAAARGAGADAFFEWLKSGTRWTRDDAAGVAALESRCRREAAWTFEAIRHLALDNAAAESVRRDAVATLALLREPARRTLAGWLTASADALHRAGAMVALRSDAAGMQLIDVLGLDAAGPRQAASLDELLTLADFTQWVDETLEASTFRDSRDAVERAGPDEIDVVITPLARAMLRPFAAAVLPGADDSRLGAFVTADSLLPHASRNALGLPGPTTRADAELLAFAQLLRLPRVTLLHRRADAGEPLEVSRLVERLSLALAERKSTLRAWLDPRIEIAVTASPTTKAAAIAPALVPRRISATSFEALRACPYRFFARSMLALAEDAELDGDLEKRDYGSWLHEVLHLFHERRLDAPASAAADESGLRSAADAALASSGFDPAEFLPWSASFEAFVPRYVRWLRLREAGGARWSRGEVELRASPAQLEGVELRGRIDRIDERGSGDTVTLELIDYKTGGANGLRERVNDPAEDTQLAFYAALVGADDTRPIRATYLALEARPELKEFEHKDVRLSAIGLIDGMAIDLRRLRDGAGLLPLGEGVACEYCEARGLCRRDHWSDAEPNEQGPS